MHISTHVECKGSLCKTNKHSEYVLRLIVVVGFVNENHVLNNSLNIEHQPKMA